MKRRALFLALTILFGAQAVADTVSRPVVMPLFRRVFDFNVAAGFTPQPLQRNDKEVLVEFLQNGETFDTWTRLVTVRGFRGIGASPASTREIAAQLFDPKPCGKSGSLFVGPEQTVTGTLRRTVVTISCGRSSGTVYPGEKAGGGEQDFLYVFRDNLHVYTLQYAMRGPAFDKPPIDPARAEAILTEQFGDVRLCASADEPGCKRAMDFAATRGFK